MVLWLIWILLFPCGSRVMNGIASSRYLGRLWRWPARGMNYHGNNRKKRVNSEENYYGHCPNNCQCLLVILAYQIAYIIQFLECFEFKTQQNVFQNCSSANRNCDMISKIRVKRPNGTYTHSVLWLQRHRAPWLLAIRLNDQRSTSCRTIEQKRPNLGWYMSITIMPLLTL